MSELVQGSVAQDWLKGIKDGALGLIPMLMALLMPQAGTTLRIGMVIAGAVVMVLGVTANIIQKDFGPADTWGKVVKDFILGLCTSAGPIITNGANEGTTLVMIVGTIGVTGISILANVIMKDVTSATGFWKIVKDFGVLGLMALGPVFSEALKNGVPVQAALGTAGVAVLTIWANSLKPNSGWNATTPPSTPQ